MRKKEINWRSNCSRIGVRMVEEAMRPNHQNSYITCASNHFRISLLKSMYSRVIIFFEKSLFEVVSSFYRKAIGNEALYFTLSGKPKYHVDVLFIAQNLDSLQIYLYIYKYICTQRSNHWNFKFTRMNPLSSWFWVNCCLNKWAYVSTVLLTEAWLNSYEPSDWLTPGRWTKEQALRMIGGQILEIDLMYEKLEK